MNKNYLLGFVKRAGVYGFSEAEALEIFKLAEDGYFGKGPQNGAKFTKGPWSETPSKHLEATKNSIREKWHAAAQQKAYSAAKGAREVIHPPTKILNKLKNLFKRK